MFRRIYLDFVTKVPEKEGTWKRIDSHRITDSLMGPFQDPEGTGWFTATVRAPEDNHFEITFFSSNRSNQLEQTILFARSVFSSLPKLEPLYKRMAYKQVKEFASVLGGRVPTRHELYDKMLLTHLEVWHPAADPKIGANLWYDVGGILGGSRICVALNARRTLETIGVG